MMTSHKGIFLIEVVIVIRVIIVHQWTVYPVAPSSVAFAESFVPVVAADVEMVKSSHSLFFRVAMGLKHTRLKRRQITGFLESADVEMRHLLSLCREFPPGVVGDAGGMRELIVSKLSPQRAWRISTRSIRLTW
jgi:hypothetical protein